MAVRVFVFRTVFHFFLLMNLPFSITYLQIPPCQSRRHRRHHQVQILPQSGMKGVGIEGFHLFSVENLVVFNGGDQELRLVVQRIIAILGATF